MALVVFMRGVNVGGHKALKPSAIARDMPDLDVVNVGAAGTFVVRKSISQAALREQVLRRLPFEAEMVICPARDVLELGRNDPFGEDPSRQAVRYVTVLAGKPRAAPSFPICQPAGKEWQVKVLGI